MAKSYPAGREGLRPPKARRTPSSFFNPQSRGASPPPSPTHLHRLHGARGQVLLTSPSCPAEVGRGAGRLRQGLRATVRVGPQQGARAARGEPVRHHGRGHGRAPGHGGVASRARALQPQRGHLRPGPDVRPLHAGACPQGGRGYTTSGRGITSRGWGRTSRGRVGQGLPLPFPAPRSGSPRSKAPRSFVEVSTGAPVLSTPLTTLTLEEAQSLENLDGPSRPPLTEGT